MRGRLLPALVACVLVATATAIGSASASAATVRVLGRDGHTRVVNDRFLPGPSTTELAPLGTGAERGPLAPASRSQEPAARLRTAASRPRRHGGKHHRRRPQITVRSTLLKLLRGHRISAAAFHSYVHQWSAALSEEHHLRGWRRTALADVTISMHNLAAGHRLTAGRLPVLFLTLQRNAQWWRHGSWLAYGDRVQFASSPIVWEYYPGAGLQLQVLANFGEANGLYEAGQQHWPTLQQLLGQLLPLAVHRAGGLTWEYYFSWEGGTPPWVSAMSQATGLIAMSNAYLATGDRGYLQIAHRMLPLLEHAPPAGVAVTTPLGSRYLQYSFAPSTDIINAFLQTLIGLYDYAQVSGDGAARTLFDRGNAQAEAELPSFRIAGWSLYQPGVFDDVGYHELVTGFAQSLCQKTATPVYCQTATAFAHDMTSAPSLRELTTTVRSGRMVALRFSLSKLAHVGVVVSRRGRNLMYTSAEFRAGHRSFRTPKLRPGLYQVTIAATDMVGHRTEINGQLRACRRPCRAP